jgi:hypothetical protein
MTAAKAARPDPGQIGFDGYGFFLWIGQFDLSTPKRLSDFAVHGRGEPAIRRLVKLLEDNGYLRRHRTALGGFGGGMGWMWVRYPHGDAPPHDSQH